MSIDSDKDKKSFYITTTLPYVNAEPHIGFAMEIIRADIIARWKRLQGYDVFFNTGTDEHGQKLFDAAQKAGKDVKEYVDIHAVRFQEILPALSLSEDIHFIRTTDSRHEVAAQAFWSRVYEKGYIYKKNYTAHYCVGCEENKTEKELIDGHCVWHPNLKIQILEEENYFFQLSKFGEKLLALYGEAEREGRSFVVPNFRLNEMREFVKSGLEDFSISRLKSKMSWGVAVPNDPEHVMYVWFDALVSYIATLGWPNDASQFGKFWEQGTPVQYCGKDNTRFQAVMWQAMLMAAELPNSHTIVVDGFITSGGHKMSKSLGNVIHPKEIVDEYGAEALRYFVSRELSTFEDSDFTKERFKESYNANLANGIGNLTSRVMKMATVSLDSPVEMTQETRINSDVGTHLDSFEISRAIDCIWERVGLSDALIALEKPFLGVRSDDPAIRDNAAMIIKKLVKELYAIAVELEPFMPQTSKKIKELVKEHKVPEVPLFARKD